VTCIAAAFVLAIAALIPAAASAQVSAPGPYVIDIRGAMSGVPGSGSFYPPVPTTIRVPQRAFGFGAGAHFYTVRIGSARLGLGLDVTRVRGSAETAPSAASTSSGATTAGTVGAVTGTATAAMSVTTVAPQLSFNFGTGEGWSYLSSGYGVTTTHAEAATSTPVAGAGGSTRNRHAPTLNVGGGARWFLRDRVAFGFDVRFHRLRAGDGAPSSQIVALTLGISVR
jgi:hypothetical protein